MTKYRIKLFVQEHIAVIFVVLVSSALIVGIFLTTDATYKHGTLGIYDTYGNVKNVISGNFKHNSDGTFTDKNGTVYKFENMLFERM